MITIANGHGESRTKFIQNASAQIESTSDTSDSRLLGVQALRIFSGRIQELPELESSLSESYEVQGQNVSTFCESIMNKIGSKAQEDVVFTVNAPKLSVRINLEHLERVLLYLLESSAEHTPAGGKIWLDFKKRGVHAHQLITSDTSCEIPGGQRESIFRPFTEIKDLTQDGGLGLPIRSLIVTKMDGNLMLDSDYTKGTRFVLELHA